MTSTTGFFAIVLGIYLIFMFYWIYATFYRGRLGPITRKAEIQEHIAKMKVLDSHNKSPDERKRKYRWFGLFSYIDDDFSTDDEEANI